MIRWRRGPLADVLSILALLVVGFSVGVWVYDGPAAVRLGSATVGMVLAYAGDRLGRRP